MGGWPLSSSQDPNLSSEPAHTCTIFQSWFTKLVPVPAPTTSPSLSRLTASPALCEAAGDSGRGEGSPPLKPPDSPVRFAKTRGSSKPLTDPRPRPQDKPPSGLDGWGGGRTGFDSSRLQQTYPAQMLNRIVPRTGMSSPFVFFLRFISALLPQTGKRATRPRKRRPRFYRTDNQQGTSPEQNMVSSVSNI